MSRHKGQDKFALNVRESLETCLAALADHEECSPLVTLRIGQAIRRTGLSDLLSPALDDMARMARDVAEAKSQVAATLAKMQE